MIDIKEFIQKQKIIVPKTGRNQPCPCGSGKKFKRCHLPKIRSENNDFNQSTM